MNIVAHFGQLLGVAGINAYRNFIPAFLYLIVIQWGLSSYSCPEGIRTVAANSPDILKNCYVIIAIGILAALEFAANFQTELREWYESSETTRVMKAIMSILTALAIISATETKAIEDTIMPMQEAGFSFTYLLAFFCGLVTWYFSMLHRGLISLVRMIDPDNDFSLNTILALLEDVFCAVMTFLIVFWPVVLIFVVLGIISIGYIAQLQYKNIESHRTHACPKCGAQVPNSAEICWSCHETQPDVCTVGAFGLPTYDKVKPNEMRKQHMVLLLAHRCPSCAKPLESDNECNACGQHIWQCGISRSDYLGIIDRRAIVHTVLCILVSWIPVIGIIPILLFRFQALMPLKCYQTTANKILGRIIKYIFRIIRIIICIICGIACPFILPIPYICQYLFYRSKFIQKSA